MPLLFEEIKKTVPDLCRCHEPGRLARPGSENQEAFFNRDPFDSLRLLRAGAAKYTPAGIILYLARVDIYLRESIEHSELAARWLTLG